MLGIRIVIIFLIVVMRIEDDIEAHVLCPVHDLLDARHPFLGDLEILVHMIVPRDRNADRLEACAPDRGEHFNRRGLAAPCLLIIQLIFRADIVDIRCVEGVAEIPAELHVFDKCHALILRHLILIDLDIRHEITRLSENIFRDRILRNAGFRQL